MGWQDCIAQKEGVEQEMRLVAVTLPKNFIPATNSILGILSDVNHQGLKDFTVSHLQP
jgi:hypothetical protein